MNKREKKKLLNEVLDLRQILEEKETLLKCIILEDGEGISTEKGSATITKVSSYMKFDATRFGFKDKYPEIYNANLVEVNRNDSVTIKRTNK